MRAAVFAVAGLCLIGSAAYAADQQQSTSGSPDKLVCKVLIHEGMATNKVVCHSQARWDTIQRGNSDAVLQFQVASYHAPFGK
jgi:hypothetical protein